MKVTKAQATENRDAILKAASGEIRSRGFENVSVAGVAKAAGLTHGALYSHFKSRDALQAEATRRAFNDTVEAFAGLDLAELAQRYLSHEHRDHAEFGCPNAALVSEVWRQPKEIQEAFREGIQSFLKMVGDALDEGEGANPDRAITLFSTMVGGLALSRAIAKVDAAGSDRILRAISSQIQMLGSV